MKKNLNDTVSYLSLSTCLPVVFLWTCAFQTKALQINELNAYTSVASKAFSQMMLYNLG